MWSEFLVLFLLELGFIAIIGILYTVMVITALYAKEGIVWLINKAYAWIMSRGEDHADTQKKQ